MNKLLAILALSLLSFSVSADSWAWDYDAGFTTSEEYNWSWDEAVTLEYDEEYSWSWE